MVDRSHQTPFFEKFGSYVADICGLACTHKVSEYVGLIVWISSINIFYFFISELIHLIWQLSLKNFSFCTSILLLLHPLFWASLDLCAGPLERAARHDGHGNQSLGGHHPQLRSQHWALLCGYSHAASGNYYMHFITHFFMSTFSSFGYHGA